MVPSNILQRTFQVKIGDNLGTAFTVEVGNKQFLITANHVLAGIPKDFTFEVRHNNAWTSIRANQIWYGETPYDLAVLFLPTDLSPRIEIQFETTPFLSQDVYFLGFPLGLSIRVDQQNSGYPLPYVKRGIIAGFDFTPKNSPIIVLDAMNNPGFSGGPVIIMNGNTPAVIGVVNSYVNQDTRVLQGGEATTMSVQTNSGLAACSPIKPVLEFLTSNLKSNN